MAKPGAEREPGPGQYNISGAEKGRVVAMSFAPFAPTPRAKNASPEKPYSGGPGFFNFKNDQLVLSKYKSYNATGFGPPGR